MTDSTCNKTKTKDMYWFAHGGEPSPEKNHHQKTDGDDEVGSPEQHNSPSWKPLQDRKALPEETRTLTNKECAAAVLDGPDNSSLLSLAERDDRVAAAPDSYGNNAIMLGHHVRASKNAEEPLKTSESEQEKNDAKGKKKLEREAAKEARRNAQRSNVSFAFGSSIPRNLDLDVTTVYQGSDLERNKRRVTSAPTATPHQKPADDRMSQSMISPMSACRGRRKTDLTPTIPYDRTAPPRTPAPPASSKRSVSMTRLDQLARPRRSYVEAQRDHAKANSTSSTSSVQKDIQNSSSRPRSSASEHSAASNRPSTTPPVNMRARATARKPRPVSIAGTMPDRKPSSELKKDVSHHRTPEKKSEGSVTKRVSSASKSTKSPVPKATHVEKPGQKTPIKHLTPKSSPIRKLTAKTKKSVAAPPSVSSMDSASSVIEDAPKVSVSPTEAPSADDESSLGLPDDKSSGKRIISEEEAKTALAEKRRLAREQAEKEAELERQRQEELRLEEEERIRKEEEEQRKMEEEQLHLLEEHRRQEEEKLRKAIEEQERKEHEEKFKREEEARMKAEQEKKAKEEAERQRIELEEKLRKEEEERAERKKRLEKIMSRTRGKGGAASGASSHSGDQSDSADSQAGETAEALSGHSSLNSIQSSDPSSGNTSLEIHADSIHGSENESLNSMDMMALSENSSLDSNLLMLPSDGPASLESDQVSNLSNQNLQPSEDITGDLKGLSSSSFVLKDDPSEPNKLFSASGDNFCSYSSDSEVGNTDTYTLVADETSQDHSLIVHDNIIDSSSDKLPDYGADSVQTLISQGEGAVPADLGFPASDPSVKENVNHDTTSDDIKVETTAKEDKFDEKLMAEQFNFTVDPVKVVTSEMPIFKTSCSEVQAVDAGLMDSEIHRLDNVESDLMGKAEADVDTPKTPLEETHLNDECHTVMSDQNLLFSNHSDECLTSQNDSVDKELTSKVFDGNSEQYVGNTEFAESSELPLKVFDVDTEQFIGSDMSHSMHLPSKVFDGDSEQYVNSTEMLQSIEMPSKAFDVNSEPQSSGGNIFDGGSEQYVKNLELTDSLNISSNPFLKNTTIVSDCDNHFPQESLSSFIKVEDSIGAISSVEDFEPSAIHTEHARINMGEQFLNASVTDSEDSSLDSNLSQVMNVNMTHSTITEEKEDLSSSLFGVGNGLPNKTEDLDFDTSSAPFLKTQHYVNDSAPATNGYQSHTMQSISYGNGINGDFKTSVAKDDHQPISSTVDNEINSNVFSSINNHDMGNILNTGDINFNKVPSNPFLTTDDSTEVMENQFINQDLQQNSIQTGFHA